jgi:hypothetical protein
MDWWQAWRGFVDLTAQLDLVLALFGLGLAVAPLEAGALAMAVLLFLTSGLATALGAQELIARFDAIQAGLANASRLGALASFVSGAALLAPPVAAVPAGLLAALANGAIAGLMIGYRSPGGPTELSFVLGALSASAAAFGAALAVRRVLGSPAWTRIAGRIVGAWLMAIAGLLLALPAAPKHAPADKPAVSSLAPAPKAFRSVVPP